MSLLWECLAYKYCKVLWGYDYTVISMKKQNNNKEKVRRGGDRDRDRKWNKDKLSWIDLFLIVVSVLLNYTHT